ncbi:radical SAM/SPASM domain-containing protein [Chloroflexota bacterium]
MLLDRKNTYNIELVALHVTNVCSHRCPFCYYASEDPAKVGHPPLERLLRIVDSLASGDVKTVSLLGGDPASYPQVVELSKYISDSGMDVAIMSNTLRFSRSTDEEVSKYISAFEATIHHYLPEEHDQFCSQKGAYNNIVKRLRKFSQLGRKTGIAINVYPSTSDLIYRIVEEVVDSHRVPLNYIVVQRIIPFGRAASTSEFTMARDNIEVALYGIDKVHKDLGLEIMVEDPFPLCVVPDGYKQYMQKCEWGYTKAAVDSYGNLSRCGADPRYRFGNILERPLLEIWNTSEILESFRSKSYLPGRCQVCVDLNDCGGGCPLSCEIDKDHGIDYLYSEYEKIDEEVHGQLEFGVARLEELSSILQLEWGNFPGYGHIFSVESIQKWYKHNSNIFNVVRDERGWVLGYVAVVPVTRYLSKQIIKGEISSLVQFPEDQVLKTKNSECWHIEVLAKIPSRTATRVGSYIIEGTGLLLLEKAKYVTASPITPIGERLCKYFGFTRVSSEYFSGSEYPIYYLQVDAEDVKKKLLRF